MLEFYSWPHAVCYAISLLFAVGVITQTLITIYSYYKYPRSRRWAIDAGLEFLILVQLFICSLMHGQALQAYTYCMIPQTGYGLARVIVFATVSAFSLIISIVYRKPRKLTIVMPSCFILPVVERLAGRVFAYLFVAALLFWLIRSILMSVSLIREVRTSISALSVKNAVDSLHTGLMFCEEGGFVLLSNAQMQRLMMDVTGRISRNGRQFYGMLTLGDVEPGCKVTWFEDGNVCLLPDGSVWMFSLTDVFIRKKKYIQITAADVTERWDLTAELQPRNEELLKRRDELNETIENLHILSRERETQKAKMRAHDILGERLTLLLRAIRSANTPDYAMLRSMSQGLMDELESANNAPAPQGELDALAKTFAAIGVEVRVDGDLPTDNDIGLLFADITREAVTNAVRHGYATLIEVGMEETHDRFRLRIADNGYPPESLAEGGGIGGMRKKLEPFGGSLHIAVTPQFVLTADVPGK